MNGKYAIDFLLFATMGIDSRSDNRDVFLNAAIDRAFRDASSHVLSIEGGNESVKKEGKGYIYQAVKRLGKAADYDSWHDGLCECLYDKSYTPEKDYPLKSVTYGIAQKWVNMTIKYLAVAYDAVKERGACKDYCGFYEQTVGKHEAKLHVPVDRYIIDAAWRESSDIKLPADNPNKRNERYGYKHPADHCKAWSKWSPDDYKKFQVSLRDSLNEKPIDWEGQKWIELAKS